MFEEDDKVNKSTYIDNEHMSHSLGLHHQYFIEPVDYIKNIRLIVSSIARIGRHELTVVLSNTRCGGNVILDWLLASLRF